MKVIADFCLIPLGNEGSLSPYIAQCQKIFQKAGLKSQLHAYGTNLEGEWDIVMDAVKACHEEIHAMGSARISSSLKIGTRTDREQTMEEKVESVRKKI